jgi:hypothetical protein
MIAPSSAASRSDLDMGDDLRRRELGEFLRSRRARIPPPAHGLPDGRYRRGTGLRREEVASLAGIGLTWYTWLEQGRDIHVSDQVLESVARILQLDPEERAYVFALAGPAASDWDIAPAELESLQRMLDRQGSNPAYLHGPRLDLIASNEAAKLVIPGLVGEQNILRSLLIGRGSLNKNAEWEAQTQRWIALFRASWARYAEHPSFKALVAELTDTSPHFRDWWPQREVGRQPVVTLDRDLPGVGWVKLERTAFEMSARPDLTLVVFTPVDPGSARLLEDFLTLARTTDVWAAWQAQLPAG